MCVCVCVCVRVCACACVCVCATIMCCHVSNACLVMCAIMYSYLHVKIESGEASVLCPAFGCYKFIPMVGFNSNVILLLRQMQDIIHNIISRKMERKFLNFDLKVYLFTCKQ